MASGVGVWATSLPWARRICAGFCNPAHAITITSERIGHWTRMRHSRAQFSGLGSLVRAQSLVGFITIMCGFKFSVPTTADFGAGLRPSRWCDVYFTVAHITASPVQRQAGMWHPQLVKRILPLVAANARPLR
jgi:hypothetical protein